jgi:4-amino-4-deoxy-L-arabinose transferase-like glycosyltransferase
MQSVSPQQPQILETAPRENLWIPPMIILAACIALYFVRLGSFGVLEGGESYYPAAVREMVEAGNMLVPRLNYQLYFSKPILTFWLLGSAYYTFGVTALAGRLWSAALCTVLALCVYWTTRAVSNMRAGLLAGLMLATSPLLIATCRRSAIDVFFSCFIGTAICATVVVLFTKNKKWWPAIYVSLALAVLTKGPAGLILFGLGVLLFLAVQRPSWKVAKAWIAQLKLLPGALIFSAIVIPWFVAIGIATKGLFLKVFFIYENLGRFAGKTNTKHAYWWWYVVTLLYGFFPWSVFLPSALFDTFKQKFARKSSAGSAVLVDGNDQTAVDARSRSDFALLFAGCSAAATLIFFSLSKTQFETYVLPAWCPLAMVLGLCVDRWLQQIEQHETVSKLLKFTSLLFTGLGAVLFIGSVVAAVLVKELQPWMRAVVPVAGLAIAGGWIAQFIQLRKGFASKAMYTLVATTYVGYAMLTPVAFEAWYHKMFADVQAIAKSLEYSDGQVAQYNDFMLSLLFYRKGPIDYFYHAEHIVPRATCDPHDCRGVRSPLLVIVKKDKVNDIINRNDVHFTLKQQRGDWFLYESSDAVLRRSPTLQEMFERQSTNDMLTDKMQAGPLTMPYGGGSLPTRFLH